MTNKQLMKILTQPYSLIPIYDVGDIVKFQHRIYKIESHNKIYTDRVCYILSPLTHNIDGSVLQEFLKPVKIKSYFNKINYKFLIG